MPTSATHCLNWLLSCVLPAIFLVTLPATALAHPPQRYDKTMCELLRLTPCPRATGDLSNILSGTAPNNAARQEHLRRTERFADRLVLQDRLTRQITLERAREGALRELLELRAAGDPLAIWWFDRLAEHRPLPNSHSPAHASIAGRPPTPL